MPVRPSIPSPLFPVRSPRPDCPTKWGKSKTSAISLGDAKPRRQADRTREFRPRAPRIVQSHDNGGFIQDAGNSCFCTRVERWSRHAHLVRDTGKDTETVTAALSREANRLLARYIATLLWDRGEAMAGNQRATVDTDVAGDSTLLADEMHQR